MDSLVSEDAMQGFCVDNTSLPSTAQVDNYFCLLRGAAKKATDSHIDDMKSKMVTTVDERGAPLELFYKIAKEMRLVWIVDFLHAPF